MKKLALACSFVLMLALFGCGGSSNDQQTQSASMGEENYQAVEATVGELDFDGSAFSDTGDGNMILQTAGGTSENGNVPEVPAEENAMCDFGLSLEGGDGSVCTIYVDGMTNDKTNFSELADVTFTVSGERLYEGVHTVELVKMDGDTPVIYKKAQYKCV